MYFHNSLIPRGAYFLLSLESKQEATWGWNFTKCILEVKVNQLEVKIHIWKWARPAFQCRDQNKAGPWTNCTQNLARAHKLFTQMALEIFGSFQNLMYNRYRKNKSGPEKYKTAGADWVLKLAVAKILKRPFWPFLSSFFFVNNRPWAA